MSKAISVSTGPIFTIFFHQMEAICVFVFDQVQFFRFFKGHCRGNQFCVKIMAKLPTPCTLHLRSCIPKQNGGLQFLFQKSNWQSFMHGL